MKVKALPLLMLLVSKINSDLKDQVTSMVVTSVRTLTRIIVAHRH